MATTTDARPAGLPAKKKDRTHYLYVAVIVAVGLGIAVGLLFPDFAKDLKPIGTGFVSLIKMMIAPVIFCTIVLGIGSVRKASQVGKVGGIALIYFLAMSTIALTIGLLVGNVIHPGEGLHITSEVAEKAATAGTVEKLVKPENKAMLTKILTYHVVAGNHDTNKLRSIVEGNGIATWTLAELAALPQACQITRHICIEGWSAIGKWGGVPFRDFLARISADTRARYIAVRCADDYRSSIDMATALHKQTLLALAFRDRPLAAAYGFPLKLRAPTKLGFKKPKHIVSIEVTNVYPGGFWEDYGYNWFSGS